MIKVYVLKYDDTEYYESSQHVIVAEGKIIYSQSDLSVNAPEDAILTRDLIKAADAKGLIEFGMAHGDSLEFVEEEFEDRDEFDSRISELTG